MLEIVLKNMTRRKLRTALATLGIVLGVTVLVSIVSISTGMTQQTTDALGKLQGIQVMEKDSMDAVFSRIPLEYADEIESMAGVQAVSRQVWVWVTSIEGPSEGFSLASFMTAVIGVEPSEMDLIKSSYSASLTEGRELESGDRYVTVVGKDILEQHDKRVGSNILINDVEFEIVGVFETGSSFVDSQMIIPIDIARDMGDFPNDMISMAQVEPENPEEAQKLATKIEMRMDDVEAKTNQEFAEDIEEVLGMMKTAQWLFSSIAAIVGGIGVMNTMVMSVMERTREFGIMKAVGWTNMDVIKNVLMESIAIGTIGGVIGLSLGFVGSAGINTMIGGLAMVTPELAAQSFIFAVALGAIGGLYPAYRASKLNPIEALRYEG
jgi:putative ABC transport system permease protein